MVRARRCLPVLGCLLAACSVRPAALAPGPSPAEGTAPADAGDWSLRLVRPDGGPLPAHPWRGALYFEGERGERYAVRVDNPTPRRVEAVVTVDGRDVLTGELADFTRHRGYVVEPYGHVVVEGFRRSLDAVAAFHFTAPEDSYTARHGTPQHVGVVGVAIFPEATPAPVAAPPAADRAEAEAWDGAGARAPRRPTLGTRYGETRHSPAVETRFERLDPDRPAAVLAVYYDDRQGLAERGIVPQPPAWDPRPFPASDRAFAPPPP